MKIVKIKHYKYPEIRELFNKDFLNKLDKLDISDTYIKNLLEGQNKDNIFKFIYNVINKEKNFYEIIISSFDWGCTYQDIQFWSKIAKSYENS